MSRGYGAMLLKKSAAGLDHLKCNVSKFSEATLFQPLESLPYRRYRYLRATLPCRCAPPRRARQGPRRGQARRAACPAAAGRGDGRTRRGPAMRRGPVLQSFSPASAAAFLRHTSRRRVAAEQLVVRCAGPADASAGVGLKSAMAALTAFMSCVSRSSAAYTCCSPSRGAGLARRPIASGGRVFPVCFGREHIFGDFGTHMKMQCFAMC
jgi:hypothetical protein